MNIAVITANMGDFEKPFNHVEQTYPFSFFHFHDGNFPSRTHSMTPRLQARIPKMFGWQLVPGFDAYLWIDSSMSMLDAGCVKWFVDQLGGADMAVFKHPHRETVRKEADYLVERLFLEKTGKKQPYISPRYEGEDIVGQLKAVDPNAPLYASTAFIYRNIDRVTAALEVWWFHTSRYHSIDQLSFPWATRGLKVNIIPDNYLKIPYLTHTRKK